MAKEIQLAGGEVFPLREFKFSLFSANPTICMVAKRGSGKSWLCQKILEYYSYLPGGVIISRTDNMNNFYGKFFPDLYIHYEYKSDILDKILVRQRKIITKCLVKYKEGKKLDPRAFLIMDDCLSSKGAWANDKPILEIFYNGRHYQLLFILTMQDPLGIKPDLRQNFDYIFLMANDFYNQQKKLHEHYAGMFPSFDLFRQVFSQVTANRGAMVIMNTAAHQNILNKVFYYRVDKLENTPVGCNQFRAFHELNFNPNWEDEHEEHNFNVERYIPTKRNHRKVVVNRI